MRTTIWWRERVLAASGHPARSLDAAANKLNSR